jgi:DNA-binding NarL/FixJ family response regulator
MPNIDWTVTALAEEHDLHPIRDSLRAEGIAVVRANNLDQALQADPSVILCDADASGCWRDALAKLRKPGRRIILLSRLADNRMWIDALNHGAFDLLHKSEDARETCGTILRALFAGRPSALDAA